MSNLGQRALDVPFPEMITNLGLAIAKAQTALDRNSIEILRIMGNAEEAPVHLPPINFKEIDENYEPSDNIKDLPSITSMIGAGFQPTFYQFAETIIEVKIVLNVHYSREFDRKRKTKYAERKTKEHTKYSFLWWNKTTKSTYATTTVDAHYTQKYDYDATCSSLLKTKLVPVPPNDLLTKRMELKAEIAQRKMQGKLNIIEKEIEKKRKELEEKMKKKTEPTPAPAPTPPK